MNYITSNLFWGWNRLTGSSAKEADDLYEVDRNTKKGRAIKYLKNNEEMLYKQRLKLQKKIESKKLIFENTSELKRQLHLVELNLEKRLKLAGRRLNKRKTISKEEAIEVLPSRVRNAYVYLQEEEKNILDELKRKNSKQLVKRLLNESDKGITDKIKSLEKKLIGKYKLVNKKYYPTRVSIRDAKLVMNKDQRERYDVVENKSLYLDKRRKLHVRRRAASLFENDNLKEDIDNEIKNLEKKMKRMLKLERIKDIKNEEIIRERKYLKTKGYKTKKTVKTILEYVMMEKDTLRGDIEELTKLKFELNKLIGSQRYILRFDVNNKRHMLTIIKENLDDIFNIILTGEKITQYSTSSESDAVMDLIIDKITNIRVSEYKGKKKQRPDNDGRFFNYINTTDIDLSRYQIYKKVPNGNLEHCLIHTLKLHKLYTVDEDYTQKELYNSIKGGYFKKTDLKKIAKYFTVCIQLRAQRNNDTRSGLIYYGDRARPIIRIALYKNHYFINDIIDGKEIYYTIRKMFEDGKFKYTSELGQRWEYTNDEIDINNPLCKPLIYKKKFKSKHTKIVYADVESTTNEQYHVPFMISWHSSGNKKISTLCGKNCIEEFLDRLYSGSLVYFHNMKYDLSFIVNKVDSVKRSIEKGGVKYQLDVTYKGKNITFRDSYKMISKPLSSFNKMFKLDVKKEVFPYDAYTSPYIFDNYMMEISLALKHVKDKDHEDFMLLVKPFLINDRYFDHFAYAKMYCERDVEVLKKGMDTFSKWMYQVTKLNTFDYLTLPSFADAFFKENGAYEGIYKIGGDCRAFIQKSVMGGQVCTMENKKYNLKGTRISDFDAVSLYPSAFVRCEGFPKGAPKPFFNKGQSSSIRDAIGEDNVTYYIVEIEITKIGKKVKMPIISKKDDKGIRQYVNEKTTMIVGKYYLEDLIRYQQIEYKIIKGYYFNQGFNTKCKELMQTLFDMRKRYKAEMNPIQEVVKLIMNSAYGKTIMKASNHEHKYIKKDELYKYRNRLIEAVEFDNFYKIKLKKSIRDHYNMAHIGGLILDYSKVIMNQVKFTAFESGIDIYYQDTDSMHLKYDEVDKLAKIYKEKYNRDLIGKELGQFHNDFPNNSWSEHCIILGKKSYVDFLNNDKGEKSCHIRLKGIPHSCIIDRGSVLDTYTRLYNKEKITFDLSSKLRFTYDKMGNVSTVTKFIRSVQFI